MNIGQSSHLQVLAESNQLAYGSCTTSQLVDGAYYQLSLLQCFFAGVGFFTTNFSVADFLAAMGFFDSGFGFSLSRPRALVAMEHWNCFSFSIFLVQTLLIPFQLGHGKS
jgi:hypothetical protein